MILSRSLVQRVQTVPAMESEALAKYAIATQTKQDISREKHFNFLLYMLPIRRVEKKKKHQKQLKF